MVSLNIPLIGKSNFINQLKKNLNKLALSNSRILIMGESGTGKKLIAQTIHQNSKFSDSLCTIIDIKNSSEKELEIFFSDLSEQLNNNIIVQSNNTTLILDNIDFLDINYQKKLLFFLENNNFFVKNKINLHQKITSISTKNIEDEIAKGNFLQALYDRLSVIIN